MTTGLSPIRVMLYAAAIIAVLALVWLLVQVRSIVVLLILGIIFSTAIEPIVFRLRRSGLSRGQSILVVYLAIFAIIVAARVEYAPPPPPGSAGPPGMNSSFPSSVCR